MCSRGCTGLRFDTVKLRRHNIPSASGQLFCEAVGGHVNIYALIPLLNVFAYAALLGLGLRHRYRRERRAFALYLAAAGFWSFVSFLLHLENPFLQQYTLAGSKVIILAAVWMTLTYYYFLRVFVQKLVSREIYLGLP